MSKNLKEVDGITYKKCSKCGEWKQLDLFYKQKKGIAERQQYCIECVKIRDIEYYSTEKGKEVARKKTKKYYNNGGKEKMYKRLKKWGNVYAKVRYALSVGHIPGTNIIFKVQECCLKNDKCSEGETQFHHTHGRRYPYKGIWLCPRHHKLVELGKIILNKMIQK